MRALRVALLIAVLAAFALIFWPNPTPEIIILPCEPGQSAPQFPRSPDLFSRVPQPKAA